MATERLVAGLRCHEVLADLSEYLDGGLSPDRREHLEAHVRGCDYCERFGQQFAETVRALRSALGPPAPLEPAMANRLRARLKRDQR